MRPSLATRPPAVAGRFYPDEAAQLAEDVDRLLAAAPSPTRAPKGIIAPHAGYVYSGPIAATAYASLRPRAHAIRKVVLLGPAHRVHFAGLALPDCERFATPLGEVEIDAELAARVSSLPFVERSTEAHALEHSLEVHLPFLQRLASVASGASGASPRGESEALLANRPKMACLPGFSLLPLVVGDAHPREVAAVLELCWGGPETAVVISSDLSHYHDYAEAVRLDRATADWITHSHAPGLDPRRACGARCIDGLIEYGAHHPLGIELLDLRNSGDTAGPRGQVVGYGAFAIHEDAEAM